jgi:hypothetical protein
MLGPARGLIYGIGLALIFWAVVAAIVAIAVF